MATVAKCWISLHCEEMSVVEVDVEEHGRPARSPRLQCFKHLARQVNVDLAFFTQTSKVDLSVNGTEGTAASWWKPFHNSVIVVAKSCFSLKDEAAWLKGDVSQCRRVRRRDGNQEASPSILDVDKCKSASKHSLNHFYLNCDNQWIQSQNLSSSHRWCKILLLVGLRPSTAPWISEEFLSWIHWGFLCL